MLNPQDTIFQLLLVLTRIGGVLMFFPGFSERYILTRANLVIALFTSSLLVGTINGLPPAPESPFILAFYLIIETMIGIIIGLSAQIIFLSLHIAGSVMSTQSGMSSANVFDPQQGEQVPIVTNILSIFCLATIFVTDTHHMMLASIAGSYTTFEPGKIFDTGELTEFGSQLISKSFVIGTKISAPFLIINIAVTVANGLLARLMPSFQVFFVMTPAQILILFLILLVTLNPILEFVVTSIQETVLLQ